MLNVEKWMVTNLGVRLSGKLKEMCVCAHAHATTCFVNCLQQTIKIKKLNFIKL